MIITCEFCFTRYVVDPLQLNPLGQRVKCTKCGHIWTKPLEREHDYSVEQASVRNWRSPFVILLAGTAIVFLSLGVRMSFAVWLNPASSDLFGGLEILSFAIALQSLFWGIATPFALIAKSRPLLKAKSHLPFSISIPTTLQPLALSI